ncbi:hypothetical protein LTR93_011337 [Exophiala xenobiotica]|nr:hypothetical protein LTR93_011337 [Exophiala xenobiotica]
MPSQETANKLVDAYFGRVHVLYPFLHEGSFRARYEQLWIAHSQRDQAQTESSWLAVANLVFAYGCEFASSEEQVHFSQRAAPFIERAKSIILSHVFSNTDIELVQALLLLSHYLQGTLELDKCWNFVGLMVRNAISLGLHIKLARNVGLSTVDKEFRKRLWWGCVVLDRTVSMKFGRPPSIVVADSNSVDIPLEVDDQYITDHSTTPRQPLGRPSRISFFVQTIRLSNIIHGILSTLYSATRNVVRKHDETSSLSRSMMEESSIIGDVLNLDGQLRGWWEDLPPHLKQQPAIPDDIDFERQRKVMRIRFLQMRLLLQRPLFLFLANNRYSDEFTKAAVIASSNVCIKAAKETIELIKSHYDGHMLNSLWYNLYYVFTSVGILAMVETLQPSHRSLLSSIDAATIEDGMRFLRSARYDSVLAARYITLLEKLKDPPTSGADMSLSVNGQDKESMPECESNVQEGRNRESTQPFLAESIIQSGYVPVLNPDGHSLPAFDPFDPIFGYGLPQGFVATDWA